MSALRAMLNELVGLFVDDGSLALALLLWTLLMGLAVALFTPAPGLAGALLAAGYLAALLATVWRTGRA
jgi:hypothetical protein